MSFTTSFFPAPHGFSGVAVVLSAGLAALPLRADQIVVRDRSYPGAQVLGLREGLLEIRTADAAQIAIPLGQVDLIVVDRAGLFDDLNEAERLMAGGEAQKAVTRYERAFRLAGGYWSDVVASRLIRAHDHLGQVDEAITYFIRLAQSRAGGSPAAAHMIPAQSPLQRNARYGRAVRELEVAVASSSVPEQRVLLALVRFELLRRAEDKRAAGAATAVMVDVPDAIRTPGVYSIVASALTIALSGEAGAAEFAALDRAMETCPEASLPDFLLLKGRYLARTAVTRDEIVRASWPFLRIAIHMPRDARAADGLLEAARILERLGSKDRAEALVTECLAHSGIPAGVASDAQAFLERLGPKSQK